MPCPLSSFAEVVLGTNVFSLYTFRSGCVKSIPVSTIAMSTFTSEGVAGCVPVGAGCGAGPGFSFVGMKTFSVLLREVMLEEVFFL